MAGEDAEIGADIDFHVERAEGDTGKSKQSKVEKRLEALRGRSEGEGDGPLRDGQTLIQEEIRDILDDPDLDGFEPPKVAELREISSALAEVAGKKDGTLNIKKMALIAPYLKLHIAKWDKPPQGTDTKVAEANKGIYSEILAEIYDQLPLPEAAIGEAPVYVFDDIDTLTGLMRQSKEKDQDKPLSVVLQVFETIEKDVTPKVDASKQVKVLDQALKHYQRHMDSPGYDTPVGILNEDGTVEFSNFEEGKSYGPTTEDGRRQFIFDIDGSYSEKTNTFFLLKKSAEKAVSGVKKLLKGEKVDDLEEIGGISAILTLLEKNEDIGSLDEDTYIKTVKEFEQLIRTKKEETNTGDKSATDEVVPEGDDDSGDQKTRHFMQNGRRLRKRYYI